MHRKQLVPAALVLAFLGLVIAEQARPWKRLQAEWRSFQIERLRGEIDAERLRIDAEELDAELATARRRFDDSRAVVRPLDKEIARAEHAGRWAQRDLARLREQRRRFAVEDEDRAMALDQEIRDLRSRLEAALLDERTAADRLAELRSELTLAEQRWAAETETLRDLESRLAGLERGFLWRVPVLRGLDGSLTVHEVAPDGFFIESPVGRLERRDRCVTCHLGALGESGEEVPPPFAGHPRSDLYVGEASPHPYSRFGCTVCHGGEGRATDFVRAGHRGAGGSQEPILPLSFIEVGCARCHSGEVTTEAGVSLELGRQTVLKMGCAGCHEIDDPSVRDAVKSGPPLGRIAAKTSPGWTFRWILEPRRFRPTTWMPHLLGTAEEATRQAEVRAMVRYLWARSAEPSFPEPPAGDGAAGEALFAQLGCKGCHLLEGALTREDVFPELERLHGPNLARTGNKVSAAWLYAWLRNPRAWRADTPMPSLRLDEREAADLTAFLMASREASWEELELPPADPAARDEAVRRYLEEEETIAESLLRFDAMSADEEDLYLGERALRAYACAGCHEIPGLEEASQAGPPLGAVGRRPQRLLDEQDAEALVHPSGLRGVPDYGLARREAEALRVTLLAWRDAEVDASRRAEQGEQARALAAGRRLLWRFGCLGCHQLDGRGGALALAKPEPPGLTSVGARLRSSWLFAYLNDPGSFPRRPWLRLRMPSFHLEAGEANDLVQFFAAHDGEPLFVSEPPAPERVDVEVGRSVAVILQCNRCHQGSPEAANLPPSALAPSYRGARQRLRPDWVVDWILGPESLIPGTAMPLSFSSGEEGTPDSSFLVAAVSAPMFEPQLQSLLPRFASEEELHAYLSDSRRVASALRDYLWTLE